MKKLVTLLFSLWYCQFAQAQSPDLYFNVISPSSVFATYGPGEFSWVAEGWGWDGTVTGTVVGELAYAPEDGQGFHRFCELTTDDFGGKIVLIDRGGCEFSTKAYNAQVQGAAAVVIVNFEESILAMAPGTVGSEVTIPVIMLTPSTSGPLLAELNAGNTVVVNFSSFPSPIARLTGQVVADANGNCSSEPGEAALDGWKVEATSSGVNKFTFTDADGQYALYLDTGSYNLNLLPPANGLWDVCPAAAVNFTGFDSLVVDLQATALLDCPLLRVDIETPIMRRCFDNNIFVVDYCNLGTLPASGASVTLTLDPLLALVSASIPAEPLPGNAFEFAIGEVGVGECGSFTVLYEVNCDAEFGQALCAVAEIFPNDACVPPTSNWTGGSVFVHGSCAGDEVIFLLENKGTGGMSGPAGYRVLRDGAEFESGTFQLDAGASQTLAYSADGATYRLEADQEPDFPEITAPGATVEACPSLAGWFSTGFVLPFPAADYGPAYDEKCDEVVGSYDPNDKKGTPIGFGPQHYIEANTDLTYLIRFQNTGTDTAFNIKIKDTISAFLDVPSLRPGPSSHHYEFELLDNNIAVFSFANIMLPDSNVNLEKSNGYVYFTVSQRLDLPLETVIHNSAAIYFDFNEPIITNETWHTIGEDFLPPSAATVVQRPGLRLDVFPNPMGHRAVFDLHGATFGEGHLEVLDALGRQVALLRFDRPRFEFVRKDLPAGNYFFQLTLDGGPAASGQILLR